LPNQWVETNQLFLENYLAILAKEEGIGIILSKHLILPVVCHAALSIITTAYLSFSGAS
jgi:hypothetical protein